MSDGHPIRNGIIATVVGGLILSFALWLVGSFFEFMNGVWAFVLGSFELLVETSFSVPVWLFSVIAVLAFFGARSLLRRLPAHSAELQRRAKVHVEAETPQEPPVTVELTELESLLLLIAARNDGKRLSVDDYAIPAGKPQVLVRHTLDELVDKDLLWRTSSALGQPHYVLTKSGRAVVVRSGHAR